jgi:hypothetical protein
MTDSRVALAELIEKGGDADFLKDVLAFSLQRLMDMEAACGVRRRSPRPLGRAGQQPKRLPRPAVGHASRPDRRAGAKVAQGQLLSFFPRTQAHCREGPDRGHSGSVYPRNINPLGR